MIREAIAKVVKGADLTEVEMVDVMNEIMGGDATSAQIASFITALRIKGETVSRDNRSREGHAREGSQGYGGRQMRS